MEFFSSEGSDTSIPIPIVALRNVDDSYPPQKKSFMMLKYMHDHYLDKYEWFMRADDDVYIKGEKLESFLRSLNSSEAIFLGQTGMGARDELGKLALEPGENFCMGGPGVIMSREVLKRMVPHIRECLQEIYTTHEDVEVGRCVRRFAGVQCVWSYEVRARGTRRSHCPWRPACLSSLCVQGTFLFLYLWVCRRQRVCNPATCRRPARRDLPLNLLLEATR